jgi:adenylate cyclase
MAREIEHKYLIKNALWRQGVMDTPYRQGYLSIDPERSVRVRVCGGNAFLAVKGISEGPARDEFEYPGPVAGAGHIPEIAGNFQWKIAEAEIEDEGQEIVKPGWVSGDVTGDPRYFNVDLLRHPYSEWAQRGK